MKDPIRSYEHGVSEESVRVRTGRPRAEWFALLDEAGAVAWEHRRIAAWLGEHGVDNWWSQLLTVRYVRTRHDREPDEPAGGAAGDT